MSEQHAPKEKENAKASLSKGVEDVKCSSPFGRYSEEDMVTKLKGIAVDPCMPQYAPDNIKLLWNQILGLRKLMVLEDSEMPWVWSLIFNFSLISSNLLFQCVL